MSFLVVDNRFVMPIYVILDIDPRLERDFPGLQVREVTLEQRAGPAPAVGRDPECLNKFREFRSDGAVVVAGFILIEPRYVGPSWRSYLTAFRPEGEKPFKRFRLPVPNGGHAPRPAPKTSPGK